MHFPCLGKLQDPIPEVLTETPIFSKPFSVIRPLYKYYVASFPMEEH